MMLILLPSLLGDIMQYSKILQHTKYKLMQYIYEFTAIFCLICLHNQIKVM